MEIKLYGNNHELDKLKINLNKIKVYFTKKFILIEKIDFLYWNDYIIYDFLLNKIYIKKNDLNMITDNLKFDKILYFSNLFFVEEKYYNKFKTINFIFVKDVLKKNNSYYPYSFYLIFHNKVNKYLILNDYSKLGKYRNYSIIIDKNYGKIQNFLCSNYLFNYFKDIYDDILNVFYLNKNLNYNLKFILIKDNKINNILIDLIEANDLNLNYILITSFEFENIKFLNMYEYLFENNYVFINLKENKNNLKNIKFNKKTNLIINLNNDFDEYFFELLKDLLEYNKELYSLIIYYWINNNFIKNNWIKNDSFSLNIEKFKILIVNWNLNGKQLNKKFNEKLIYKINEYEPLLFIIGFQELFELKINGFKGLINKSLNSIKNEIRKNLKNLLINKYELIIDNSLLALYQVLFIKKEYKYYIKNLNYDNIKMGYLNMGNKGCINFNFNINFINFVFSCCHLESGYGNNSLNKRKSNLKSILNNNIKNNYFHFIYGDLNFKINNNYDWTINKLKNKDYKEILKYDELISIKKKNNLNEKDINFIPTFKFKNNCLEYNDDVKKIPSYTDRILFKTNCNKIIKELEYDIFLINGSDHLPIYSVYEINLK